uniref:Putative capsid morphogenesis protein n=1 Tax=viral metagenome TaxID=1070528 RepID=A0A6M3IXK9_9ZZZZ
MITVLQEIDEILVILEVSIPANPASPENEKLARKMEEDMSTYFASLEQAFPYASLDAIYNRHVKVRESGPIGETEDLLDPMLRAFRANLVYRLNSHVITAYLAGSTQIITWGVTKGGIPIAFEGPPIRQAIDYAREHCAQLVTKMDDESKKLIAQTVSDAIENKRGIPGLARDIRSQFEDMSRTRSQTIARTETCDALEQGFMDRAEDMGITGKEWIVTDPCPICEENGNEGVVPIDHVFSGGVERPPQHPNCRCALAPVMIKGEK